MAASARGTYDAIADSKIAVVKVETVWALNVVDCNYYFNSSSVAGELFCVMFPDSEIVREFHCRRREEV